MTALENMRANMRAISLVAEQERKRVITGGGAAGAVADEDEEEDRTHSIRLDATDKLRPADCATDEDSTLDISLERPPPRLRVAWDASVTDPKAKAAGGSKGISSKLPWKKKKR